MVERHNGYGENSVDNMMVDYDYPPGLNRQMKVAF